MDELRRGRCPGRGSPRSLPPPRGQGKRLLARDANYGYDLEGAKRFLERAGSLNLAFVEESFDERVGQCLELKRFMAEHGWRTLLADGETLHQLDAFRPFIAAKAIDLLQADMNAFGIEGILQEAAMAKPQGLCVCPHNWGSLVGFFLQLHVGRAVPNFFLCRA